VPRAGTGAARSAHEKLVNGSWALSLRVLREDEVEAALEDLRGGRAGAGVRERVLRGLELLEQPAGDGDVKARELRVERLDLVARWLRGVDHGHPSGSRDFTRVKLKRVGAAGAGLAGLCGRRRDGRGARGSGS
jgi:hypothetical protein